MLVIDVHFSCMCSLHVSKAYVARMCCMKSSDRETLLLVSVPTLVASQGFEDSR